MKTRRRFGAGAAGVAVLLLAAPTTATHSAAADAPERSAPARAGTPVRSTVRRTVLVAEAQAAPPPTAPPPPAPVVFCPVEGGAEFVDSWGAPRSGGRRHQGVDMLAAHGTPVVAPVAGTVTNRNNGAGGLSYHLIADDGTYYYGTHLSSYGATGYVPAGTVIGYVGDTGNARGTPHLHFEIHPGGEGAEAINPHPTVAAWCGVA